jgi:hypothetical protein
MQIFKDDWRGYTLLAYIARLTRLRSTLHPPPDSRSFAFVILRLEI